MAVKRDIVISYQYWQQVTNLLQLTRFKYTTNAHTNKIKQTNKMLTLYLAC